MFRSSLTHVFICFFLLAFSASANAKTLADVALTLSCKAQTSPPPEEPYGLVDFTASVVLGTQERTQSRLGTLKFVNSTGVVSDYSSELVSATTALTYDTAFLGSTGLSFDLQGSASVSAVIMYIETDLTARTSAKNIYANIIILKKDGRSQEGEALCDVVVFR